MDSNKKEYDRFEQKGEGVEVTHIPDKNKDAIKDLQKLANKDKS